MNKIIKTKNYKFLVSVGNLKNYPKCKWPRELPRENFIRGFRTIYIDPENTVVKQILYPQKFWFEKVELDDPIENDIIEIKNLWPDWYMIQVI